MPCAGSEATRHDLISERGGVIALDTNEACDEDEAWRVGLMLKSKR